MKKTFLALLSIVLCFTMLSGVAYAAETPNEEYEVEIVSVTNDEMQARGGVIGSTVNYVEKTVTYNIRRSGVTIATVDCIVN